MATINNISFSGYGLVLANYKGIVDVPATKEEIFMVYGKAGYQPTKRRANTLDINGFIIANDLADFKTKTAALFTVFSSAGIKIINLGNDDINTFAKEGFKITNVHIQGKVYAKFYIKLHII